MAYVALYRSYRPTTFKEVIGQKHVVKTLKNAIIENKTSHAYIFSGLRGIGKTTIARILAKAVNCENPLDGEPCNTCKNCLSIINDETTDIIELDAASNNGVDEMRDILEKVNFLPSVLRKKVYIIDEAHMLSTAAFNALLKTLEEPPAYVIFVLATTEPHKIPATILSRCQRFDFKQFTLNELKEELSFVCNKENINITEDALYAIAEASDGGMRDALSILDQANVYATDEITIDDVDSVTGRISNYKLIELLKSLKEKDSSKSIYIINELINMGKETNRLVSGIIQFCRDILLYKSGIESSLKYIYNNEEFINLANSLTTNELFYYIDILVDVQNKIRFTNSQKIYLEVGIIKIVNTIDENLDILEKIHKLEQNSGTNTSGAIYNNEYDNRINALDNKIKRINNEMERAKLDEFKEKIEAKLDLLEDVSSKNAAIPTDLNFRLDNLEDKIRVLNSTNNAENNEEISKINEKFNVLEEQIKNITSPVTAIENVNVDENTIEALKTQVSILEEKVQNLGQNTPVSSNNELAEKVQFLEEYISEFSTNFEKINVNNGDNSEILQEISELKENYFALIKTIQENNTNKTTNNIADELGFIDDVVENNNDNISKMVDELLANVNRISFKLQENNSSIEKLNEEVLKLSNKDNELSDLINNTINDVNSFKDNNIEEKITKVEEKLNNVENKITDLEKNDSEIKDEISKLKQVGSINKPVEKKVEVKEEPKATKPVEQEYVKPVEEKRVIVSNETNTLQTHKNVYDVRIVERILHEARDIECREEKVRLVNGWKRLEDKVGYVLAPAAKMLADSKLVANGKNELLIVYPTATLCNHMMEPKNYNDAKQVLRITFGKDYDYLALPENTWQEKRGEYIGQYGVGIKYPKLTPINNKELNVVTVNYKQTESYQKKPLQQAKAFFGSALVEEEKDE